MIIQGDCLDKLKTLDDNSIDSIVTDPPYGLSFMNKKWDYQVPSKEIWIEALRVLKPGGHLLAFGGTRTYHRLVVNIEDAGFEIRDQIQWNFGSGFPKSCDIKKSGIKQGIICECEGNYKLLDLWQRSGKVEMLGQANQTTNLLKSLQRENEIEGSDKIQQQWPRKEMSSEGNASREESSLEGRSNLQANEGQLHRPEICSMSEGLHSDVSQGRICNGTPIDNSETHKENTDSNGSGSSQRSQYKKQSDKKLRTLANESKPQESGAWPRCPECLKHVVSEGIGSALKPANEPICVARKPLEKGLTLAANVLKYGTGGINIDASRIGTEQIKVDHKKGNSNSLSYKDKGEGPPQFSHSTFHTGRWPANIILDEEAAMMLDEQSGELQSRPNKNPRPIGEFAFVNQKESDLHRQQYETSKGGASRFFYCAKASKSERNAGLEGMQTQPGGSLSGRNDKRKGDKPQLSERQNFHPTVKPIKLMEYLVRLVTPKNGVTLDPFMGSGSTGVAAKNLGFNFIGIELNPEYVEIAEKRIESA